MANTEQLDILYKLKKSISIVLVDFFISRKGYLSKKFFNERYKAVTRIYERITKGPHSKKKAQI